MTPGQLTNFAANLACEWDLSEIEADDVLATGATVAMGECDGYTVRAQMEMRAEVVALVGSDMEDWIEGFKEALGGME